MALVHLIPYWLVWAEIECMVQVALTKLPMNQFKLVHQKHITVAECPNVYTVYLRYILYVGFSCVVDLKFISSHTLKK